MFRRNVVSAVLLGCAALVLTGCMPHMTIDEMKAQMPKRPLELDRLNAFVGKWQTEGTATFAMLDEPLKLTGTSECNWEGNKWYVVERGVMRMADFPEAQMLGTWSYDTHAKKYRSTYVDSMGMTGMCECTYNDKTDTWAMTANSFGPWGKSTMKGTLRFVNPDTMEWTMTEHMGFTKIMEMKGTGKRVK